MAWTELVAGRCGAKAGRVDVDPGLVWADATGFADFRREGATHAEPFPVLVELHDDGATPGPGAIERLHDELLRFGGAVPAVYPRTSCPAIHHCTAWFSSAYCHAVLNDPHHKLGRMIKRFRLQLPVIPARPRPAALPVAIPSGAVRLSAQGLLIGVIDSGCPFAHMDLRDTTGLGTRVLNIWDQDPNPMFATPLCAGAAPADLGYGCEVSRVQLNALMQHCRHRGVIDENACYAEAGESRLHQRYTHGAAVLGLLVGRHLFFLRRELSAGTPPFWNNINDAASRADVVFVQTPRDLVQDSSSAALERHLLDGLRYIIACAGDDTRRIVVNISDGSMRGTHDGESMFELALAELVDEQAALGRDLHIVLAAGNAYADRRHAQVDVPAAAGPWEKTVTLQLPPGNETPVYAFMRVPAGRNAPSVCLEPTSVPAAASPWVDAGQAWGLFGNGPVPALGVIYPQRDAGRSSLAMIAFATTATRSALAGRWKIRVKGDHPLDEPLHFYIALGQRNAGALQRTQQPRFVDVDETYDPGRALRSRPEDPKPPLSAIRRLGTLGSLSTAKAKPGVWVVGSAMLQPWAISAYSSAGPSASANARQEIDFAMPVDESPALLGMRSMGVRSGETVRVSGTSFAAPQFARFIADQPGSGSPPPLAPRRLTIGPGANPQ